MAIATHRNHNAQRACARLEREQAELERQAARVLAHLQILDEGTPEYDLAYHQYRKLETKAQEVSDKLDQLMLFD